jgi:hypothetical protein
MRNDSRKVNICLKSGIVQHSNCLGGTIKMRVQVDDLFGQIFLRKKGVPSNLKGYYESLIGLVPFLRGEGWGLTTGYYINCARDDSVRLSYFIRPEDDILPIIDSFISDFGFEYAQSPSPSKVFEVSDSYGKEELRFRRYLSIYTLVGLDIIAANLFHSRCLFATFRLQVMAQRLPFKPHFESTFIKYSPYYCSMSEEEKNAFWSDISHWPNPPQVDWAHMFLNMVLGREWFDFFKLPPQPPMTIQDINYSLASDNMDYRIPVDWTPYIL